MKRWHLPTLGPSSDKRTAREPGPDAPRVPTAGAQKPRVLFSSSECRLIALDLDAGEELDVVPKHVGSSGSPWRLSAVQGSSVQGGHRMKLHRNAALSWSGRRSWRAACGRAGLDADGGGRGRRCQRALRA